MKIKQFTFNLLKENCYVAFDEDTHDCAIIDPGCYYPEEKEKLSSFLKNENLVPDKILLTHGHLDHLFGAQYLTEEFPLAKVYAHRNDQGFIDHVAEQGRMFGIDIEQTAPISHYVAEGELISIGKTKLHVICTPGHSPGGVCYYCEEKNVLFSGDTIFLESVGRTDLYGGSDEILYNSLHSKIFTLPGDTTIYPGHGPATSVGYEKHSNPYI